MGIQAVRWLDCDQIAPARAKLVEMFKANKSRPAKYIQFKVSRLDKIGDKMKFLMSAWSVNQTTNQLSFLISVWIEENQTLIHWLSEVSKMSMVEEGPSSTWNRDVVDVHTGSRFQAKHMAAMVAKVVWYRDNYDGRWEVDGADNYWWADDNDP